MRKTVARLGRPVLAALALILVQADGARAERPQEYQVKAAMVYNMAKYVEWPRGSFSAGGAPLSVCSVGRGPFAAALEQYLGKTVLGHPLDVRRLALGEDVADCHLLVVSGVEKRYLASILDQAGRKNILTVGDVADFARLGGMIGLIEEGGRVRFEINVTAAGQSRLKISSQLLKLAKIIREGDP